MRWLLFFVVLLPSIAAFGLGLWLARRGKRHAYAAVSVGLVAVLVRALVRYVPELEAVPNRYIHAPWKMGAIDQAAARVRIGVDYPAPVVDHALARGRIAGPAVGPVGVLRTRRLVEMREQGSLR